MVHLLLLYRVLFYTFGFSILGLTIYKYIKTRNTVVKAFLFLWAAMTATAASYVINYYIQIILNIDGAYMGYRLQGITILLTSIALPVFVHTIFNIKRKLFIYIVSTMVILLTICMSLPFNYSVHVVISFLIMSMICLSNVYSYIVSFKRVWRFNSRSDRRLGLFFMLTFLILFCMLLVIDIMSSDGQSDFLFFPIFYMWIGGFCAYLGFTKLNLNEKRSVNFIEILAQKFKLTKRQSEIAQLLAKGYTYKKIAEELFISPGTVSTHVMHIYDKTGTKSKIELNNKLSSYK